MPIMNYHKGNQENNPIHNCFKKSKIPRNKPNQGGKRPVLGKLYDSEETKEDTVSGSTYCVQG